MGTLFAKLLRDVESRWRHVYVLFRLEVVQVKIIIDLSIHLNFQVA